MRLTVNGYLLDENISIQEAATKICYEYEIRQKRGESTILESLRKYLEVEVKKKGKEPRLYQVRQD